ncbi:hypothetical protein FSP39_007507 [Pinctada imbricata]|uniref:Poly [ADP-ribose] polymerase n=1 Tax=Pinctada imbricata TaxID=66713 RepID=A0AA88Y2T8_PINIB|nr:hypothetical protein FSP39_007507 [Pinctada imbricata]
MSYCSRRDIERMSSPCRNHKKSRLKPLSHCGEFDLRVVASCNSPQLVICRMELVQMSSHVEEMSPDVARTRPATKLLSEGFIYWKETQLKVEKIEVLCEIPDSWLVELDLTTSPFPSQQSPQEAESAVSNPPGPNQGPPGPNQGPPGPNQGPPGPNQGPYQVPPGFQGYQGYTGGPGFYPGMYTGQGVPPGQEGFQNMPNVAQGFNYYMLPPMPPGMPYQLPQGPTDRQDQGSLGSVNKTEEAQHQGPFLPHFGFPQAYPGYFPYPQYPIGEDQQKMQGGVLPPPYEATMEKMPHGRSPMFNLDSSSESSKSSSTVMKHRSEESSSGITSESESSGRESEHQKPVEEIECKMIKVSNIPEGTTEDALTYFFENRRKSGGGPVEEVEFDESTLTAIITFEESNVVQRILGKLPILFNKKQITIEEFKPDMGDDVTTDDTETFPDGGFVIEVRGFKDSTSPDTIEMYFENKRRSGGGEIKGINSEKMEDGVVFIEFEEESVMESVLSKKHKIDGAHVEVIKYEPPPPPKPVPTYNNKVFIKNINPITSRDGLENFLEAKANAIPTDVVFGIEEGIALVTFEEEIDFEKLKLACQKKSLDKFYMKIQRVPITNCIIVKGFSERTSQDTLEFYFDNKRRSGGEGVLDVVMDKDEGFCIVSFEEPDVVDEVCKRNHKVEGCELDVRIHYQCLGQVVEEGRETSEEFHIPEPLVMKDVEVKKLEFLVQSESNRDALDKTVADLYGKIDWPKNRGQAKSNPFIVECTLTKEVKDYKKIARTWAKDVAAEVDKFLKLLVVEKHSTVHDAWSSVIDGLKSINVTKPDAVAVILEKNECEIFIIGYKHPVEDLSKQIIEIMGRVREEMDRRKERTKDVAKLKHFQVLYLQALKFGDEMLQNYRDFKVTYDIKKHSIMFEGLSGEIMEVKMKMFEIINGISKSDAGKFSKERQEFLKSTEVKNYVLDKFKENELIAVWEITDNQDHVNVYSKADEDAVKAAHVLKESVVESTIKIDKEASQLLSTPLWGRKRAEELENARGLANIIPHPQKLEITILCVDSTHGLVREFVEDFMRNNAIYQQSLTLSVGVMRFIQVQSGDEVRTIEESLQKDQVKIDTSDDAITIQGTSVGLSKAKRKIDELVQTIELKKHSINKVGIGKHLQSSQGQERITKIEKSEGVVIEFSDDSDQSEEVLRQDKTFASAQSKKELAVCLTSRAQKLIAVVCDMTELEADVLVNAANRDLKHIGGLAKVIVQKGGDVIQEECDRQIKSDRRLLEGEVFVSSPGSLRCKMIVHAVAPVWQNGRNNEEDYLREAVMKSMEEGSNRQLKSIAFPALSTGVFGYPARQATRVIVEALRDFFRECQDSSVDMVYLCDVKEDNVDLFVDGLMKTFGPDTVTDKRTGSGRKASHWHTSSKRTDGKSRGSPRSGQGISTGGGNVNIQVIKGQIARQQVDIIVNTTSKDLRLTNGAVSNSLLNAAGPSIQQECNMNYPNGVQHGQVAVTKGGNLRCSFVCHGSLPSWDSSGSSLRTLHQFMKSCLDVAHQRGLKSIAFPALGTGNLGYPKDIVAREMFSAVFKFTSSNTGSSISDVRFVLYEKDTATIKAFEFEEKRQSSGGGGGGGGRHNRQLNQGHGGDSGTRPKTGYSSTSYSGGNYRYGGDSSSDSQVELDIGQITLKVYQGDITQADVECIVNSSNRELDLNRGKVSQVLLRMGGYELEQQVKLQRRDMKDKGVAVTTCGSGSGLNCKMIIHVDVESYSTHLKALITKTLEKANEIDCNSIALPALGQVYNIKATDLAKYVFEAIMDVESNTKNLREVHMVLFEGKMVVPFMESLRRCCEKHVKPGKLNAIKKFMGFGKQSEGNVSWDKRRFVPINSASVTLLIYGKSLDKIDRAIQKLEGGIKELFTEKIFNESVIKNFTEEQERELKHLESSFDVAVNFEKRIGRIRIEGLPEDLMSATDKIHIMIRKADNKRQEEAEAQLLADMVEWCFIDVTSDGQTLEKYPPSINRLLERALRKQESAATFTDNQGVEYVVDFQNYEEYPKNDPTDTVTVIRRSKVDGTELPSNWTRMDDKENVSVVQLQATDPEYQKVVKDFTTSAGGGMYNIVKVERIQNKMLYHQYAAKKSLLDKQNPVSVQNEMTLWHGTAFDAIPSINTYGFNRSYCGKNATAYGMGVYFAVNAQYSASDTYSPRDVSNNKRLYLCKVLTGEYTRASNGMRVPPAKNPATPHILYDSVVDNPNVPGIFVIFNDTQAYPDYLITFS